MQSRWIRWSFLAVQSPGEKWNPRLFRQVESSKDVLLVSIQLLWQNIPESGISNKVNAVSSGQLRTVEMFNICKRYGKSKKNCQNRRGFDFSPAVWTARKDHRNHWDCISRGGFGRFRYQRGISLRIILAAEAHHHLVNINVTDIAIWFDNYKH